jgi:predicted nuclease of predicted toxin-antitoxin system
MVALLLDENLSHRVVRRVESSFPGSAHVRAVGLLGSSDDDIWSYAATRGLIVVTKDDDFRQRSFLRGAPPKVIWLVLANVSYSVVVDLLLSRRSDIERFAVDVENALLVLKPGTTS